MDRGRERGERVEGGREGGKHNPKTILSQKLTPNSARNSVHQATCRAKLFIAKILRHSYLAAKNTRAQLFRARKY